MQTLGGRKELTGGEPFIKADCRMVQKLKNKTEWGTKTEKLNRDMLATEPMEPEET